MLGREQLGNRRAQHRADRFCIRRPGAAHSDGHLCAFSYFSHFANHVREWPGGIPFSSPKGSYPSFW